MKTIETDRLVLRMFRQSDLDAYAAMHADPEIMRFLGEGKPLSREESWRSLAVMVGHWHLRGFGLWAVTTRESDEIIGRVGCWYPEGWPGFEIGWTLARSHWGRGYATEAARAAIAYAFRELDQPKIISLIRPGNDRSVRVAEALGEQLEGSIDLLGNEVVVYGLKRADWEPADHKARTIAGGN